VTPESLYLRGIVERNAARMVADDPNIAAILRAMMAARGDDLWLRESKEGELTCYGRGGRGGFRCADAAHCHRGRPEGAWPKAPRRPRPPDVGFQPAAKTAPRFCRDAATQPPPCPLLPRLRVPRVQVLLEEAEDTLVLVGPGGRLGEPVVLHRVDGYLPVVLAQFD